MAVRQGDSEASLGEHNLRSNCSTRHVAVQGALTPTGCFAAASSAALAAAGSAALAAVSSAALAAASTAALAP